MEFQQSSGFVVWFTGMNRAGKSTLAAQVASRLKGAGQKVELLDEDGAASVLLGGLGNAKDDQDARVRRLGFTAAAVARAGGIAVCAALSPYREPREALRREVRGRFIEVFVDCAMEALHARDPKGLYKRALAGEVTGVPGVDVPYEPPVHAELVLHTDQEAVEPAVQKVFQALVYERLIGPADFGRLTGGLRPKRKPARAARGGARRKLVAKAAERKAPRKVAARTPRPAKRRR